MVFASWSCLVINIMSISETDLNGLSDERRHAPMNPDGRYSLEREIHLIHPLFKAFNKVSQSMVIGL